MGGLSANQGLVITAHGHLNKAKSLRSEAASLMRRGKTQEAESLLRQADNLEKSAQKLLDQYERQNK